MDRASTRPTEGPLAREQVLLRRRYALIGLLVAVVVTLVLALVTGSSLFLIITLIVDVALAGYVALLLQIKQTQQARSPRAGAGRS